MSATVAVGIDVGSQKTMMAKNDADIVRTDTGRMLYYTSYRTSTQFMHV